MYYVDLTQVLAKLDTIISINSIVEVCSVLICLVCLFICFRIKKGVN